MWKCIVDNRYTLLLNTHRYSSVRVIWLLSAVAAFLLGYCISSKGSAAEDETQEAQKYHAALQKRPEPGYLFDRFYNAWLDHSTAELLQEFLEKQVEQEDTASNRLLLAFFHSKQNNDLAAIDEYAKALKSNPSNAAVLYYKAQAESRTLDFAAAIADLKHARDLNANAKLAVAIDRQLGTILLRNRQNDEASAVWQALLAANPDDEELSEDIIELQIEEGMFPEAADALQALIGRTKDPYTAVMRRLRLGDIHYRSGQRQSAIDVYASALGESGQDTWLEREILAQFEQIFRVEDDLPGLKREYAALIETYPKRIDLLRRRCRLLAELGEHDDAVIGYHAILELTPGDRANCEEYVDMLCHIGRYETAVKELETLCRQDVKDAELQFRLAKTLQQAKQPDQAAEAIVQYLKVSEQSEYAYLRVARFLDSLGKKEDAADLYQTLAKTFPDSPSAQEAHAVFLDANGRKEEAVAIWTKLIQTADVNQALSIARTLDARGSDLTLDLLASREEDFGDEPLFLSQLVNTALRLKKFERAIPWAKRRVELSRSATELEAAITQLTAACRQCDKVSDLIVELKSAAERPIQLTCLLAELLEGVGNSAEANEVLRLPAEKGDLFAVGEQIRLFGLRGEWILAADATQRLFELSGGRQSEQVRKLVELYERDGRIDEALRWIDTWKRLSPGATMPWLAQARMQRLQGKEGEELSTLQRAVQRFDEDVELRTQLAHAYQESGKTHDAARVYWHLYEKATDVGVKLRWVSELAKLAHDEGTISQLAEDFRQRSRNNRESVVPLLALAEVYRVADDYENRRQTLLAATRIKPDDPQLLTHIARLEEVEGDWKLAISTLEQALPLDKTDQTRQKIARLHIEYGNRETGYAMLRELLGEGISDPRVLERMADSLCAAQEWDRVIELLRDRISEHPNDHRLGYLLGIAYEELGQTSEAIARFVLLLNSQNDPLCARMNKPHNAHTSVSYVDVLQHLLPDEAFEWFQLQRYRQPAYSYRKRPQAGLNGLAPIGVSSSPSFDVLRPYAMVHLVTLAGGLDELQQEALVADLKAHGTRNPKALLALGSKRGSLVSSIEDALDAQPNDESLLALFVALGTQQQKTERGRDLARAFTTLREKSPELAVMAATHAASTSREYAPILDEALVLASKIERPNPLVVLSLAKSLGGLPWMQEGSESAISADQREKLVNLLVAWHPTMSPDNNELFSLHGSWYFFWVVGAVRASDNVETYFTLLDDEVDRWRRNAGKQGGQSRQAAHRQAGASLLEPISFPPQQLTDFPPHVCKLLAAAPGSSHGRIAALGSKEDWDAEKIKPRIEGTKDPTLRLLLANRYGLPEIAEATLAEMLAAKPPQLDAYLLAAGKAIAASRLGEVVDLLEAAQNLPMNEEARCQIDASFVAVALAVKSDDSNHDRILKAGRDAAYRLRRQRLDQRQREQLGAAFAVLGLGEQSKGLAALATSNRVAPTTLLARSAATVPAAPTPKERIDRLVASDKRDAAVRLLANEVRKVGQMPLFSASNIQAYRQAMRELKKQIANYGLADDVLSQFPAGEGANATRLCEYALACELLDREQESQKAYRRLLVLRPTDDASRVRLLMLMVASDGNADAIESLSIGLNEGADVYGQILTAGVDDPEAGWDDRFHCVELAISRLAKQKDGSRGNAHWATQLVQAFGHERSGNSPHASLPSLYQRQHTVAQGQPVDAQTLERRATLHRELCLKMIELPDLRRVGFQHLLAAAEARGDALQRSPDGTAATSSDAELCRYAEDIVLAEAQHKGSRGQAGTLPYSGSYASRRDVRFRSPAEYLVAHAWRSGDWSRLDDQLMPKLTDSPNQQVRQSLDDMIRLYRCPNESFLTVAEEALEESSTAVLSPEDRLVSVVNVWADRKMAVDLQSIVVDAIRHNMTTANTATIALALGRYIETVVGDGTANRAENIIEEVAAIYLGPAGNRAEYVARNHQLNRLAPGDIDARIQVYASLLDQLAQQAPLFFLVLTQARSLPDALQKDGVALKLQETLQRARSKPDDMAALLESSPWLADLEQFRVLPLGQRVEDWPLAQILRDSTLLTEERSRPVWMALENQQKANATFGRGLLLAARAQQTDRKELLAFLDRHIGEVERLPANRQAELCSLAIAILPPEVLKGRSGVSKNTFDAQHRLTVDRLRAAATLSAASSHD